MKPRLFIASSSDSESLNVVREIQVLLEDDVEATGWQQVFEISGTTLESLIEATMAFDFAVFVFSPVDTVVIRGESQRTVRDNVIFELGLLMGALGKSRVFIVKPKGVENFRLPTDLAGFTSVDYDSKRSDGDLASALAPGVHKMRKAIRNHLARPGGEEKDVLIATLLRQIDVLSLASLRTRPMHNRIELSAIPLVDLSQTLAGGVRVTDDVAEVSGGLGDASERRALKSHYQFFHGRSIGGCDHQLVALLSFVECHFHQS